MLIVTNFKNFPTRWTTGGGIVGGSVLAESVEEFLRYRDDQSAVFLVNCDVRLVLNLVRAQSFSFGPKRPLIAVDLVLRKPTSITGRVVALGKRVMLRRVDHFLHYFQDVTEIEKQYGIGPERSGFVWFKANLWQSRVTEPKPDGDYVLCFGRSLRDFDTFFEAMAMIDVPGAIVDPHVASVWEHGSRFTRSVESIPANVRVMEDDLSVGSQVALLMGAKLVVVPIVRGSMVASGISTILNAMILGKCVIASAGPGVTDIFDRGLLSVPVEDPRALASMILRAWSDDEFRETTARAGWERAQLCGSEQDMFGRIIDSVVAWRVAIA